MYKISLFLLIILYACGDGTRPKDISKDQTAQQIGTSAQLVLTDLTDQPIDLEKYKGKTVFINFWATWCKPCREEMPSIKEAMNILKDEKVEFFFASDESKEQIEDFKKAHDYNFNYVRAENLANFRIMGLPTTFIFNPGGELVFSEMGYRKWDEKANIDLILNKVETK